MKFLKSYGIVLAIAIFFIGIFIFVGLDESKNTLRGKSVGGEDIVFGLDGKNVTTNEYYDEVYTLMGDATVATLFESAVANQAVETTDELQASAQLLADNTRSGYASQYGQEEGDAQIVSVLKAYGYSTIDDLDDYFLTSVKTSTLSETYIDAHYDEYVAPYFETSSPRILSHILVQYAPATSTDEELDSTTLTDEELLEIAEATMAEVDAALAAGTSFEEVATTYSDDTGSAVNGGYLGFSDASTSYVTEFLEASLTLSEGETSAWIQTEYGFHLIRCESTAYEKIMETEPESLYEAILTANPTLKSIVLWEKAQELGVTFATDEIKANLLTSLGIADLVEGE
ncbi:MAG: peptidylprolyl isomerase [Anaerorhabdus sp.]